MCGAGSVNSERLMPKDTDGRLGLVSTLISLALFLGVAVEPGLMIGAAWFWFIAYEFHAVRQVAKRVEATRLA